MMYVPYTLRCPWLVHTTRVMANLAYAALDRWRGPYHACQASPFPTDGKASLLTQQPRCYLTQRLVNLNAPYLRALILSYLRSH